MRIKRREFITLLGGAATLPVAARAQQPVMPVIGSLYGVSAAQMADNMAAFRRGLGEMGFVEGRNVQIEYRWADGHFDRMPAMAADLISRNVNVILVGGNTAGVREVMAATHTIPIVFATAADPVAVGLASLNRPGGNATGVTNLNVELGSKRLELLHEVVPTATKMALLVNPNNPVISQGDIRVALAAALRLGLEIIVVNGGSESKIERGISTAVQQGAAALYVGVDAFFGGQREKIAALALLHAIPTMLTGEAHTTGVLMSYVTDPTELYRQAGVYVGRILKGEKPADLPVQQSTKAELIINLKTAKALGLTVPLALLTRADEVIE
jgi:putative ABC transport system substrate-binding protein